MTAPGPAETATEGTCDTCMHPIPPGAGRTYTIEQATGRGAVLLLHTDPRDCVRTTPVRRSL